MLMAWSSVLFLHSSQDYHFQSHEFERKFYPCVCQPFLLLEGCSCIKIYVVFKLKLLNVTHKIFIMSLVLLLKFCSKCFILYGFVQNKLQTSLHQSKLNFAMLKNRYVEAKERLVFSCTLSKKNYHITVHVTSHDVIFISWSFLFHWHKNVGHQQQWIVNLCVWQRMC